MWTILILVAVLVVWQLLGKRLLAGFLLSGAGQGTLQGIGKKAVDTQPDGIRLIRIATPVWDDTTCSSSFRRCAPPGLPTPEPIPWT